MRQRRPGDVPMQLAQGDQLMPLRAPAREEGFEGRGEAAAFELGVQGEDLVAIGRGLRSSALSKKYLSTA